MPRARSRVRSWHDDARLKFAAIQRWRQQFLAVHGREPTVWLDKLCIDQENIEAQLASLPVYLAGCRSVLALSGPSYFQRLWCVLELHIFYQMGGQLEQIVFEPIHTLPGERSAASAVADYAPFDVRNARASDPRDEGRLLAVIEGSGEGINAFNSWVRMMLLKAAPHEVP